MSQIIFFYKKKTIIFFNLKICPNPHNCLQYYERVLKDFLVNILSIAQIWLNINFGGSPLEQHHQIGKKKKEKKKKKELLSLILSNMFEKFHFYLHIST
jgi:hypothetical protein